MGTKTTIRRLSLADQGKSGIFLLRMTFMQRKRASYLILTAKLVCLLGRVSLSLVFHNDSSIKAVGVHEKCQKSMRLTETNVK